MEFHIVLSAEADAQLTALEGDASQAKVLKAVRKTLGLMETNLKHRSLQTHEYDTMSTGEYKVFEAYAQNKTPGAYRVFWKYGPENGQITILAITPHP